MLDVAPLAGAALLAIAMAILLAWRRPRAVVQHAGVTLTAVALVSTAAAWALVDVTTPAFRMRLDPSEEPMLTRGDPAREVYREAIRNFGDDDVFVIGMQTDDVFTTENLRTLERASRRIRKLRGVRSTESLVDTTTYRYVPEEDLVEVQAFIDDVPRDPAALADLRERALTDRIYPRTIVSRDGTTAAINVSFRTMSDGEFVAAGIDDTIRNILAGAATDDRRFFVTGRQHIKARTHALMVRDLTRLIPLAVVVGASVAWLITGSLRTAVIPVGASLLATLWAFGALAFLGRPMNLIMLVLGPTLICVGSVYGVHVLARFDALAAEAHDPKDAALACVRYTFTPVLIAGLTTCVGFGALLISDTPAIQELGAFSALGVAAVTAISVTGVPALLGLLGSRRAVTAEPAGRRAPFARLAAYLTRALERVLARVAVVATTRPQTVLAGWAAVAVGAILAIPHIVVDTDYLTFFDRRSDVRLDFAAVSEHLVGAVPIYVVLTGPGEGAFREPENLRALEALQARVDAIPAVSATLSVVDLVEVLNRAIERDDPAAERIPDTRGEVADVIFLIPKNKLRPFANANHSSANLLVRTGVSGSAAVRALEAELYAAIAATDLPAGLSATVTGNTILVNKSADGIARNQLATVSFATLTILLLVSRAFRSVAVGLLAMLPNVVPVLLFFGALGGGIAVLSLPTSLIGCIALGIAVDDTAHFLVGYRTRREAGLDPPAAAAACVRQLGQPIAITSMMLVAGFLVLSLSEFATLREFGYLSAATMLICLCADLLMLPAILVRARV